MTERVNLEKSVKALLKMGRAEELKETLASLHPADIAEVLEKVRNGSQETLFKMLDAEKAAEVMEELDVAVQKHLMEGLSEHEISNIFKEMSVDEVTDLLQKLPPKQVKNMLMRLPAEDLEVVKELLEMKEDTAGGIMTTDYVYIPDTARVDEAIKMVRKFGKTAETIYYLYIVNNRHELVGVMSLRELLRAPRDAQISEVMHRQVIAVDVGEDQEQVAKVIEKYSLLAVPVISSEGKLLGIVTVDDAIEVLEEETTEDIHRLAGITAEEDKILIGSPFHEARKRIPWLLFCLFGDLLAGSVIKIFSPTLEAMLAVAFFIPVLMATGGNAGTQSLALAVRGLATREINSKNFWRYMFQEAVAGLFVGLICGGIIAAVAFLWQKNTVLGLVVGSSMSIALTIAAFIGMAIPMLFNYFSVDPAVASGPFITTLVDVNTLIIYFAMVTLLLKGVL